MKKQILIVICYVILPWIYGGFNQLISRKAVIAPSNFKDLLFTQAIVPIFFAINLVLFLCLLAFLYIKILKYIKPNCIVSILGVSIYPLSYYFVILLSWMGSDTNFITNIIMKATPFLYFDRLSLPVLLTVSFMSLIINWSIKKGRVMKYIETIINIKK